MKLTIEAVTEQEIAILARSISLALGKSNSPQVSCKEITRENSTALSTEKQPAKRGRPKKVQQTEQPQVSVAEENSVPAIDFETFRERVVRAADISELHKNAVAKILQSFTTDGGSKTVNVPENSRQAVLDAVESISVTPSDV